MPVPRSLRVIVLSLLLALTAGVAQAAPPAPDYGGRDSAPLTTVGAEAPNPAAQAGRALEALVVVLAGVAGVVYLLKRFDLVKPGAGGRPARISVPSFGRSPAADSGVAVISSQALPGGMMLHVVRVAGRNLLLAATAQSVTAVTEWPLLDADPLADANPANMADEFEDYLSRANPNAPEAASGIAAANARLRSLLSSPKPEEPS